MEGTREQHTEKIPGVKTYEEMGGRGVSLADCLKSIAHGGGIRRIEETKPILGARHVRVHLDTPEFDGLVIMLIVTPDGRIEGMTLECEGETESTALFHSKPEKGEEESGVGALRRVVTGHPLIKER
jgi:hypothetical protein